MAKREELIQIPFGRLAEGDLCSVTKGGAGRNCKRAANRAEQLSGGAYYELGAEDLVYIVKPAPAAEGLPIYQATGGEVTGIALVGEGRGLPFQVVAVNSLMGFFQSGRQAGKTKALKEAKEKGGSDV